MRFGYSDRCLEHDTGERHPENPDRLRAIRRGLAKRHGVEYAEADPATREEVVAVHDAEYVDELEAFVADGGGSWDPDTVASEGTWDAALASAGLAQWAARSALDGADGRDTPFALGRPPGHHAVPDDAMGFAFSTTPLSRPRPSSTTGPQTGSQSSTGTYITETGLKTCSTTAATCSTRRSTRRDSIRIPERSTRPATTRGREQR